MTLWVGQSPSVGNRITRKVDLASTLIRTTMTINQHTVNCGVCEGSHVAGLDTHTFVRNHHCLPYGLLLQPNYTRLLKEDTNKEDGQQSMAGYNLYVCLCWQVH